MATTTFSINDPTKVSLIGRWTSNNVSLQLASQGTEMRFAFTGTQVEFNHAAGGTAAFDLSIDGGAYFGVTTTNTSSKTLVSPAGASGLTDTLHTCSLRVNTGNTPRIWIADGIQVTGAAPAISAYPNHDTSGTQHIYYPDSRIVHNFADQANGVFSIDMTSPCFARTSSASHKCGLVRFKTDGATLWCLSYSGGIRCYVDGFAEQESTVTPASGTTTPVWGWVSFSLPNDGQMHEIAIVGPRAIDQVMVQGGTGIYASDLAAGLRQCKVALVGDSVTSGDSATGYANTSASLHILAHFALDGRFTPFNRGLSGDWVTQWLSSGRQWGDLKPIDPDIVVSFMGVNEISLLTSDGLINAKRDEYIVMYTEILKRCPKAKLYQFQINPDHSATVTAQYNRVITAQTAAIASVAASYPSRVVQFIAADAGWTYGPATPTTGYTRAGAHPYPSGNCYGMGKNHASVVLSSQPSGGDSITMTVAGTSYTFTFNAGSHGASPNPVTIGAAVGNTITNLKDTMLSVLGRKNLVTWTNGSSEGYFVGVRNCTAISKSGTNVFAYRLSVPGFADMLDALVPAAPSTSGGSRGGGIARGIASGIAG